METNNETSDEAAGAVGGGDHVPSSGDAVYKDNDVDDGFVSEGNNNSHEQNNDNSSNANANDNFESSDPQYDAYQGSIRFTDHFSLRAPSSSIRLRHSKLHVYSQNTSQVIIEEKAAEAASAPAFTSNNNGSGSNAQPVSEIIVKQSGTSNFGQLALRFWYTLVCTFFSGFLFIFCFQVMLYLFLNLTVEAGATSQQKADVLAFLTNLLSLPVFVHGFSSAMAIAVSFVSDTWKGHPVLKTIGRHKVTTVYLEWFSLSIYLGIPLLVLCIALFARAPNWWEITALVWYGCVFFFWCYYALVVTIIEVKSFVELVIASHEHCARGGFLELVNTAVLLRQVQRYSGRIKKWFLVKSSDYDASKDDESEGNGLRRVPSSKHMVHRERRGWYGRATQLMCCGRYLYENLDPPERTFTVEEVLGLQRVITFDSWSLERIYCQSMSSRSMVVVNGESALLTSQVKSSLACSILGNLMVILLVVSLLYWFGAGGVVIGVVAVLVLICCIPSSRGIVTAYKAYDITHKEKTDEPAAEDESDIENNDVDVTSRANESEENNALYSFRETWRVTKPRVGLSWSLFGIEVVCFVVWPLIALFTVSNWQGGILFAIVAAFSYVRFYFNASVALEYLGSLDAFDATAGRGKSKKSMITKSRLRDIVVNISRARSRHVFAFVFSTLILIFIFLSVGAINTSSNESTGENKDLESGLLTADAFQYPEQPDLPYPTCRLKKGLELPDSNSAPLSDFAFVSATTYYNQRQEMLNKYFGEGIVVDEIETVKSFKQEERGDSASAPMFLYSVPSTPGFGIIAVRGTQSSWDLLADARLWSAAFLAQVVRFFLPMGQIWTVILDDLVWLVSLVDSAEMKKVSYYIEVTDFANYLLSSGNYTNLILTGHSLGGGISLISGAQTGLPSIGISAPNALLSRHTFIPPITSDQLSTHTFNIIPNRDVVPMVDDEADLYQRIKCRTAASDFLGCHAVGQTLCELQFTCGSGDRPILCACVTEHGFPKPEQLGNQTFEEVCLTT